MGIMIYSILWVMQDIDHQPYDLNPKPHSYHPQESCTKALSLQGV